MTPDKLVWGDVNSPDDIPPFMVWYSHLPLFEPSLPSSPETPELPLVPEEPLVPLEPELPLVPEEPAIATFPMQAIVFGAGDSFE